MPGAVAIDDGHLVLNGSNVAQHGIEAALRFQARVAVIPQGGTLQLRDGEFVVTRRGRGAGAGRHRHQLSPLR